MSTAHDDKSHRSRTLMALDAMIESVREDMRENDPGNHATIGALNGELKGLMAARTYVELDSVRSHVAQCPVCLGPTTDKAGRPNACGSGHCPALDCAPSTTPRIRRFRASVLDGYANIKEHSEGAYCLYSEVEAALSAIVPLGAAAYVVEEDDNGCKHCHAGRSYTIVGPDGVGAGRSWEDADEVAVLADWLCDAFNRGRSAASACSDLESAVNIGLATLGHFNTEQTDKHWNAQERVLREIQDRLRRPDGGKQTDG